MYTSGVEFGSFGRDRGSGRGIGRMDRLPAVGDCWGGEAEQAASTATVSVWAELGSRTVVAAAAVDGDGRAQRSAAGAGDADRLSDVGLDLSAAVGSVAVERMGSRQSRFEAPTVVPWIRPPDGRGQSSGDGRLGGIWLVQHSTMLRAQCP